MSPPGSPPRNPNSRAVAGLTLPRNPAASHPGFEREEDTSPGGVVRQPVVGELAIVVRDGFAHLSTQLALRGEVDAVHKEYIALKHQFEIERIARTNFQARTEERLRDLEEDLEDTGQHSKAALEKEIERMRGSQAHWVRYVIGAIVTAVVTLLLSVLLRKP